MAGRRVTSWRVFLALIAAIAVAVLGAALLLSPQDSPESILRRSRVAMLAGDLVFAEQLAAGIPEADAAWVAGRLIAGECATRRRDYPAAIKYYSAVPRDGSNQSTSAVVALAEVYFEVGRLAESLECYQYALQYEPGNVTALFRTAFLLGASGQRWESLPYYLGLVRVGGWTVENLTLLADLERPHEQKVFFQESLQKTPDDHLAQLGIAFNHLIDGETEQALRRLKAFVDRHPENTGAQALLGELLIDGDREAFVSWNASLPESADHHGGIWFVRGLWCRRQNEVEMAARCFWEAVLRIPNHRRANYQLGQILISLGVTEGDEFAERASQLFELSQRLDVVLRSKGRSEPDVEQTARILFATGRVLETWAWASLGQNEFPDASWPRELMTKVTPRLSSDTPWTLESACLGLRHDLSGFPLPDELLSRGVYRSKVDLTSRQTRRLIFDDEAEAAGFSFVYHNGDVDLEHRGARMFEQSGGGVGVVDYDCDRCPDLYLPQGTRWPLGSSVPVPDGSLKDCLFRNIDGQRFASSAFLAGVDEEGFGQGVSAGDFNNDGFVDLYVANIGRNQLLENNGDGTFTDVTQAAGLEFTDWTTSCLVVDLNADGAPDLFDVTYVDGPDVFVALCENGYGCSPKNFEGIENRLLISNGDGTFRPVSNATPKDNSKGMGAIAICLDQRDRPSLFISNDQVPNFFLRNEPSSEPSGVRFVDEGFATGLAYNEDGLAMACMGIAAGDPDNNGLPDIFVTNFRDEANTLYLQDAPSLFVDATNNAGLVGPSLPYVGWGTQFLDADLDGHEDLIVVNGHIDDYRSQGGLFWMPALLFSNSGNGRFSLCDASESGSFFARDYLGRGLARLDWNGDGRMDFAVSNMNAPATLATNRTETDSHFVNVCLHATGLARDAIGAVVTVACGDEIATRQLIGGDGFMATNERVLQFGLGDKDEPVLVTVEWPSGVSTTLRHVPVDVTLAVVEGASDATLWDAGQNQAPRLHE